VKKLENRVVVVCRATRLANVLASQNTVSQAKFYINQLGGDFAEYEEEHRQYNLSLAQVRAQLDVIANVQLLDRAYLPNFVFAPGDIVVVVGQDGLVANTLKYLDGQPVIGVNPDASRWDGVLLPFAPKDAARVVEETVLGRRKFEAVSMARVRVQDGQELHAVNDFFIGQKTHASARYVLKYNGLKEPQSSSGIIVSTGLGSTGWMKSVIAGAKRISTSVIGSPYGAAQESENLSSCDGEARKAPGARHPRRSRKLKDYLEAHSMDKGAMEMAAPEKKKVFGVSQLSRVIGAWGSTELVFAVREPFPSKTTGTNLVFGTISAEQPLRVESLMGENGVIFSDGVESDFIAFNSGTEAAISLAEKKGRMVV
jgi:NAD kinase